MIAAGPGSASAGGGTLPRLIAESVATRGRVETLSRQVATGRVADTFGGLGGGARTSLTLRPQIARTEAWQGNIEAVQGRLAETQSSLKGIAGIASKFHADTGKLYEASEVDMMAWQAREALRTMTGLLNGRSGDTYVFAGQDSANPPIPDSDDILTSPFVTGIRDAVQGLAANGAAATAAATLGVASGVSPFSPTLVGLGGDAAPRVEVGEGQYVQAGVLADRNTLAESTGDATTGSYMRDVMRALATIGSLSGAQATAPGFKALVEDTRSSLDGAIGALAAETGALGNLEAGLDTRKTHLEDQAVVLKGQLSSVEDVDMAEALSRLTEAQTRLQASYQLIAGTRDLSLVNFL